MAVSNPQERIVDIAALTGIGAILLLIHFVVPSSLQSRLAFEYDQVRVWAIYTAAFVHNSNSHLFANLFGYTITVSFSYSLCIKQARRRWFWLTLGVFLVVLPILTNLTSYAAFQALDIETTSRGFSGVVAGLVGFLLASLAGSLIDQYGIDNARAVGQGIFILLLGEVAVIYSGLPSVSVIAALLLGLTLAFGELGVKALRRTWSEGERRSVMLESAFVSLHVVVLTIFVWLLFPVEITSGGSTTNIIGHAGGFLWGMILSVSLLWLVLQNGTD
jgi:membrane associated rhomboid family serine protease